MKFVIDTNIIFSALIKDSVTRAILLISGKTFYYPETAFEEIKKYRELMASKAHLSAKEFDKLFEFLRKRINIVPEKTFRPFLLEADKEIGAVDKKDVMFLALALALPNEGIWSEDRHLERQKKVKVWKTNEMIRFLTE